MQDLYPRPHSPFDSGAIDRLRRMGLLTADGQADRDAMLIFCPGYIVDEAQRIIQLDGNENAEFVFTNSIKLGRYSPGGRYLPHHQSEG